jgi:hypothetical protein
MGCFSRWMHTCAYVAVTSPPAPGEVLMRRPRPLELSSPSMEAGFVQALGGAYDAIARRARWPQSLALADLLTAVCRDGAQLRS